MVVAQMADLQTEVGSVHLRMTTTTIVAQARIDQVVVVVVVDQGTSQAEEMHKHATSNRCMHLFNINKVMFV